MVLWNPISKNKIDAADYQIFKANLSFQPNYAGYFHRGKNIRYFIFGSGNFVVLNENFEIAQLVHLTPGTATIDTGDINADGFDDLIEVTRNSIYISYQNSAGIFSAATQMLTGYFLSPPGVQITEQIHLAEDVNGDGFADLVIPGDYNYTYYINQQGALRKEKSIDCPFESSFSNRYWRNSDLKANRIAVKTYLPAVYFRDLNHDGIKDLYCRYKNIVYYYISGKNESGRNEAFLNRITKSYPVNLQSEYASDFFLEDMDSDGITDAVFSVVSGLGLKIKTEVYIYWGKSDIPDSALSERMTESGGFFTPLILENKGQKQLLIPTMNLGVSFFLSYILEKKMMIKGNIYSMSEEKYYRKYKKISAHSMSFQVSDNLFPGFTVGDFNKDGISDIALASEFNEVILHYGDNAMAGKKSISLSLPGYGIIYTVEKTPTSDEIIVYLPQKLPGYDSRRIYLVRFNI